MPSKRYKKALELVDAKKLHALNSAVEVLTRFPKAKFNETVELAFRLGMGRGPTAAEREAATEFLAAEPPTSEAAGKSSAKWNDFCQMIFASNAFLFVE